MMRVRNVALTGTLIAAAMIGAVLIWRPSATKVLAGTEGASGRGRPTRGDNSELLGLRGRDVDFQIEGNVISTVANAPIAAAKVYASVVSDARDGRAIVAETSTDGRGTFLLNDLSGMSISFDVRAPGYVMLRNQMLRYEAKWLTNGQIPKKVIILMEQTGHVQELIYSDALLNLSPSGVIRKVDLLSGRRLDTFVQSEAWVELGVKRTNDSLRRYPWSFEIGCAGGGLVEVSSSAPENLAPEVGYTPRFENVFFRRGSRLEG
jgi:hypothetical protein